MIVKQESNVAIFASYHHYQAIRPLILSTAAAGIDGHRSPEFFLTTY